MIHLHRAQEEVRMLQAEIDELTIERDTLKTALSSIFQANHMVKKEILHVCTPISADTNVPMCCSTLTLTSGLIPDRSWVTQSTIYMRPVVREVVLTREDWGWGRCNIPPGSPRRREMQRCTAVLCAFRRWGIVISWHTHTHTHTH